MPVVVKGQSKRERERETDIQRDRKTDKVSEIQIERYTDRKTDKKSEIQLERYTDRHRDRQETERSTDWQSDL